MFLTTIAFVGAFIEAFIELIKMMIDKPDWKPLVALALGAGAVFAFPGMDILEYVSIETALVGIAKTSLTAFMVGVLMARYSGALNDVLEFVANLKHQ